MGAADLGEEGYQVCPLLFFFLLTGLKSSVHGIKFANLGIISHATCTVDVWSYMGVAFSWSSKYIQGADPMYLIFNKAILLAPHTLFMCFF
jgi:hypothetical protein